MDKDYSGYDTDKLLEMWDKGAKWLTQKEHAYPGNKARDGSLYDEELFISGLRKIEAIEDELASRGKHGLLEKRAVETFTKPLDEEVDMLAEMDKMGL